MKYLEVRERFFFSTLYSARALRPTLKLLTPCEASANAKGIKYYVRDDSRAGYAVTVKGEVIHQWLLDEAYGELFKSAVDNDANHGVLLHTVNRPVDDEELL
jgi:hypothetical protein